MKTILLLLLFSSTFCFAQGKCDKECSQLSDVEYVLFPEVEAKFPDGNLELKNYLFYNFEVPEDYDGIFQGMFFVQFIVKDDGSIHDIEIIHGMDKKLNKSVLNLIKEMPNWLPAQCNDKLVNSIVKLPIRIHFK